MVTMRSISPAGLLRECVHCERALAGFGWYC